MSSLLSNLRATLLSSIGAPALRGSSLPWEPPGGGAALAPPASTVAPVASGIPAVGNTLSCTTGTWTGTPTPTFTYQWRRDGVNIGGATASTRVCTVDDVGPAIDCVVTATNAVTAVTADSNNLTGPLHRLAFASRANATGDYASTADHADFSQTTALSIAYKIYVPVHAGLVYSLRGVLSQWTYGTAGTARLSVTLGNTDANHTTTLFIGNGTNDTTVASGTGANNCLVRGTEYEVCWVYNGAGVDNATRLLLYIRTIGGTWSQITLTFGGTVPATLPNTAAPLNIGRWEAYPSAQALLGHLWDVRWFSTNLTPSGTDDLSLATCTARWRFREGSGTAAVDEIGGKSLTLSHTSGGDLRPGWVLDGWYGGGAGSGTVVLHIGDSKTAGTLYSGAHRAECRNRLVGRHGKTFNYVGANTDSSPRPGFDDCQHGAYAGDWLDQAATSNDILGRGVPQVTTYTAVVVIVQGGTNDIANSSTAADTLDRLEAVIDAVRALAASIKIVVEVDPVLSTTYSATHNTYRGDIPAMVAGKSDANLFCFEPDLSTGDLGDGTIGASAIHQSQVGYEKRGEQLADFIVANGIL